MAGIDAVYTWVDGADPQYAPIRDRHAREAGVAHNPERDRDGLDLLRYSLRSLQENAPWIERVWLVTARPQKPAWLAPGALRVVHHDEIFPDAGLLPTFNSDAIEFHLRRIPGLATRFLYLCDDMLVMRRLKPHHLLRRGRIRLYLSREPMPDPERDGPLGQYKRKLHATNRELDRFCGPHVRRRIQHGPSLLHRDWLAGDEDDPAVRATISGRFREDTHLDFQTWATFRLLHERPADTEVVPAWEALAFGTRLVKLNNHAFDLRQARRWLRLWPPRFLCLNDDLGPEPDPDFVQEVRAELERLFPRPSRFEG